MDCPACEKGNIRVIKEVCCSCGHHFLGCDNCFTVFSVECGPPFDQAKLPSEYPIGVNHGFMRAREEVIKLNAKHGNREDATSYFNQLILSSPLLEEFKVSLTQQSN